MLRLTVISVGASRAVLKAEGQIVAEWTGLFERECRALLRQHRPLHVDLSAVTYIDREGQRVLRSFAPGQLVVEGCPPLLHAMLSGEEST